MKLHDNPLSGHGHRARVFLKLLDVDHETVFINLAKGEQHGEAFRKLNPLGEVPVLVDGDAVVRDSTAILVYLALKANPARSWLPTDPVLAAHVQSWLVTSVKEMSQGPFVAVDAVLSEPVSTPKFPVNRENTGKFHEIECLSPIFTWNT